jgi:hypothetical protein
MTETTPIDWTTTRTTTSNVRISDGGAEYFATVDPALHPAEIVDEFVRTYEGPETDEQREALRATLTITTL